MAANSLPIVRWTTLAAMASMTGSIRRLCTMAAGRSAWTPISTAVAAFSPLAPIQTSAPTPVASVPCARSTDGIRTIVPTIAPNTAMRARRCMKVRTCPGVRTRSMTRCKTWARPDSMTERPRCVSRAATGSSAANPNSAVNAAPSAPATMHRFPGLNNTISSGRRISNDYPYGDRPDWQRDSYRQSQNYQTYPNYQNRP